MERYLELLQSEDTTPVDYERLVWLHIGRATPSQPLVEAFME